MASSMQAIDCAAADQLAVIEDCLNNYGSDVHLYHSPLASQAVVKCQLPAGNASNPELVASIVRSVLDDLINALGSSEQCDLNSPSVRRYMIAHYLYRCGLKQTEICPTHLPLSKSQFYRERSETLVALTHYVQQWEQHIVERRRLSALKTLAMLSPGSDTHLVGVEPLVEQVSNALTAIDGPKLIMLSAIGGMGKTAVAQAAVERVLQADQFYALTWINCQREQFTGTDIEPVAAPEISVDEFFNQLLRQLSPISLSDRQLFEVVSDQAPEEKVTFDHVLGVLHQQLEQREPSHLPLSEKRSLAIDLLSDSSALIVLDGLEAVPEAQILIEEVRHLASRTRVKVLITSRLRFGDYHSCKHIEVHSLTEPDGMQLIRTLAEQQGIEAISRATDEELRQIASVAGGNPLVLKWIVNQLAAIPLDPVLSELAHVAGLGRDLYQFMYRHTWERLSTPAQQVLNAIARLPLRQTTWKTLSNITELRTDYLNRSLQELVRASLVQVSTGPDMAYRIGGMTRTFTLDTQGSSKSSRKRTIRPYRETYGQRAG